MPMLCWAWGSVVHEGQGAVSWEWRHKLATVIHQDAGFGVFVAKSFGNMGWVAVSFV